MRITPSITSRNFLAGIENQNMLLETASNQLSSGKKLNRLSDSPSGSAELVLLKNQMAAIDTYTANAENTQFFLNVADSALSSAYDLVTTIFTRGSAAAAETQNQASLSTLAGEIRTLRDELLAMANTQAQGRSIFAGTRVTAPAFAFSDDTVTYQGDSGINSVDVGESLEVRQNVAGDSVFLPLFEKVNGLIAAIESGDAASIASALSQWSPALAGISRARVQLGTDLRKLENAKNTQETQDLNVRSRLSSVADADLAKAATDLAQAQTSLKATLSAQTLVQQYNLFDFLG